MMKFCRNCGKELMDAAVVCPSCGYSQANRQSGGSNTSSGVGIALTCLGAIFTFISVLFMINEADGAFGYSTWDYNYGGGRELAMGVLVCSIVAFVIGIVLVYCSKNK